MCGAHELGERPLQGGVPGIGLRDLVVGDVLEQARHPLPEEENGVSIEPGLEFVVVGDEECIGELRLKKLKLSCWGN